MSGQLKIVQYKPLQTQTDVYIVVKSGKYSYYSAIGEKRQNNLVDFNENFTIKPHHSQSLEFEVWDYWMTNGMCLGRGIVEGNQKNDLKMVAIKNSQKQVIGDLMIHLVIEQAPQQGSSFCVPSNKPFLNAYTNSFNDQFQQKQTFSHSNSISNSTQVANTDSLRPSLKGSLTGQVGNVALIKQTYN